MTPTNGNLLAEVNGGASSVSSFDTTDPTIDAHNDETSNNETSNNEVTNNDTTDDIESTNTGGSSTEGVRIFLCEQEKIQGLMQEAVKAKWKSLGFDEKERWTYEDVETIENDNETFKHEITKIGGVEVKAVTVGVLLWILKGVFKIKGGRGNNEEGFIGVIGESKTLRK